MSYKVELVPLLSLPSPLTEPLRFHTQLYLFLETFGRSRRLRHSHDKRYVLRSSPPTTYLRLRIVGNGSRTVTITGSSLPSFTEKAGTPWSVDERHMVLSYSEIFGDLPVSFRRPQERHVNWDYLKGKGKGLMF